MCILNFDPLATRKQKPKLQVPKPSGSGLRRSFRLGLALLALLLLSANTYAQTTQLGSDIDGEAAGDEFGHSVAVSHSGDTMAVGAPGNDTAGLVRIYAYDATSGSWAQIGSDIEGEASGDSSGYSVSLSADGRRVAIGAPFNNDGGFNAGHARIYEYNASSNSWIQMGGDIDGMYQRLIGDRAGSVVSLSADGSRVAIGSPGAKHTQIYEYNASTMSWTQVGSDIDGSSGDGLGKSVSLSADGSRVAIGDPSYLEFCIQLGRTRIFEYSTSTGSWTQLGSDISGDSNYENIGSSVSLSADGSRVAIGARPRDGGGYTRIYEYNEITMSWANLGGSIDLEGSASLSADGSRVAIGAPDENQTTIYEYDTAFSSWIQLGLTINGKDTLDESGYSVALSANGNRVAIGSIQSFNDTGYAQVFDLSQSPLFPAVSISSTENFPTTANPIPLTITFSEAVSGFAADDITVYGIAADYITLINGAVSNLSTSDSTIFSAEITPGSAGTFRVDIQEAAARSVSTDLINRGKEFFFYYTVILDDQLGNTLYGEAAGDKFGHSVAVSHSGDTMAVGAPLFNDTVGQVRIFTYNATNGAWTQIGSDIEGEANGDESGYSVSLSADGRRVAIGAPSNDGNGRGSGHTRIYEFDPSSNSWSQMGSDIDGISGGINGYRAGTSISLSNDGNRVAIGGPGGSGSFSSSLGYTRIYEFDPSSNSWSQLGSDIEGEAEGDQSGYSVSLSGDGNRVAIGAISNDVNGTDAGHTRIYEFQSGRWAQIGRDIDGEAEGDKSGYSVSLSADGSRVAIGAIGNDGNGDDAGHTRIFEFQSGRWTQLGRNLEGVRLEDESGWSVSLSADGRKVAIGAPLNDVRGSEKFDNRGHTRLYEYDSATNIWTLPDRDIDGEAQGDVSGYSVSLSADGSRIAIGAPLNNGTGFNAGHVRVIQLTAPTSIEAQSAMVDQVQVIAEGRSLLLRDEARVLGEATQIRLYDLTGREVLHRRIQPQQSISVGHLPEGAYLYQLSGSKDKGSLQTVRGKVILR